MKFQIPFTISSLEKLKRNSKFFLKRIKQKRSAVLESQLRNSGIDMSREEYLAICLRSFSYAFVILFVISTTILAFLRVSMFYLLGLSLSLLFSLFVFFSQRIYPRIYVSRRQRNIEKNLIPALEDMLIQLSSGIPVFSIITSISARDYGELSEEFKKAVIKINSGLPQEEVLEELGEKNPSIFFRRVLWQISNGMRAGSDMSIVIKDSIKTLNEEQMIQIQNYGNKLNPLIVMYMLISVIIPALSITFLIIISSMINLPENMVILLFLGLFAVDILGQVMFLGMIKSRRPSLL